MSFARCIFCCQFLSSAKEEENYLQEENTGFQKEKNILKHYYIYT